MHEQSNHMFFRVDSPHDIKRANINDINLEYELIIISDYNKGFLLEEDIENITSRHKNVFLDTKKILGPWANGCKYIKINDYEYKSSEKFIDNTLVDKIIHTMGPNGCNFQGKNYPVEGVEVKDSSGAGDTFMAGLAATYSQTGDIIVGIEAANRYAAEAVKRRGVSII